VAKPSKPTQGVEQKRGNAGRGWDCWVEVVRNVRLREMSYSARSVCGQFVEEELGVHQVDCRCAHRLVRQFCLYENTHTHTHTTNQTIMHLPISWCDICTYTLCTRSHACTIIHMHIHTDAHASTHRRCA
jgi:hypothetical protein